MTKLTFYVRFGELIGRGAQGLAVLLLLVAIVVGWPKAAVKQLPSFFKEGM